MSQTVPPSRVPYSAEEAARLTAAACAAIAQAPTLQAALLDAACSIRRAAGWDYVDVFFTQGMHGHPQYLASDHDGRERDVVMEAQRRAAPPALHDAVMGPLLNAGFYRIDPVAAEENARARAVADLGYAAVLGVLIRPEGGLHAAMVFAHGVALRDDPWVPAVEGMRTALAAALAHRAHQLDIEAFWASSPDAMVVVDATGRLLAMNPAASSILGWPRDRLIGAAVAEFVHGDDRDAVIDGARRLAGGQAFTVGKVRLRRQDGTFREIHVRASARQEEGRYNCVMQDVTEFREAMRENSRLAHAYVLLRRMGEEVRAAASVDDLFRRACGCAVEDGNIRMCWIGLHDPATGTISPVATGGASVTIMAGMHVSTREGPLMHAPVATAVRTGQPVVVRDIAAERGGEGWRDRADIHGLRSSAAFPLRANGDVIGALAVYSTEPNAFGDDEVKLLADVAADIGHGYEALQRRELRWQAEARVRELQAHQQRGQRLESIGTLAGGIAHDLNNALAPIVMSVGLLKKVATDDAALRHVRTIESSAVRAAALVKQVLSFARGMGGVKVPIAVRHVMRDVAGMLDATLFKDVTVHTNAARNLPMVVADPTQLHQVLLNLAVNAAQAMRGRGDLWITAELVALTGDEAERIPGGRPGSYVCLAVADTGSGIAPAVLERIFEPFFTTKGPGEGTGLGLSTSLGIVRDHGGFIGVETARDTGTMFRVYLPPAPDDVTAADDGGRASAELAGGGELVLVVDDEDALLSLIVETLATYGYRTIRAANGAEGIAAFASNASEVAVVLTDVKMPVMDGIAMLKVIHQIKPGVRVVAMSGVDTSLDDAGRMVAEGVTCVLQKPFDAAQLARALREALEAQEPTP